MRKISSLDNTETKKLVSLHQAKGRREHGCFIAEGWRTISTLISGNMNPIAIYITEELFDTAQETFPKHEFTLVSHSVMKKISQAATPSGVLAVFASRQNPAAASMGPGLVLANITDPGNMGTLIRTAVAMNVKTVVIVEGVDPWSHKVVQATAGTIAHINLFQTGWQHLVRSKNGLKLYALVPTGGKNIEKTKCSDGLLVIGNEAHGLPEEWAAQCEEQITIPMPGRAESLNAAIAGSIAAYLVFGKKS